MKGIPSSIPSKGFTLNRKELMSAAVVNIHLSSRVVDRGREWSGVPSYSLGTVESFQVVGRKKVTEKTFKVLAP